MESNMTTTWTARPLASAQVLELPQAAAEKAHMTVGYGGVAFGGASAPAAQLARPQLARPQVQVQGTSVPNGKSVVSKPSVIGTDPVGGVRGIPPRGWPV